MSEQIKRHPLAIAWDKWLTSVEGDQCRQANTLAHNANHYLEGRLHRAFDAGTRAVPSEADKQLLAITIERLDDGSAWADESDELRDLKALIERIK